MFPLYIAQDNGVHLNWPGAFTRHGWWAEPGPVVREKAEERQRRLRELETHFTEAAARARRPEAAPADVRVQALAGLFTGEVTLFVQAEQAQDIQDAVLFADRLGVKRTVLVGGYDAWSVADPLRDKRVAVVLRRLHSLPLRNDDDVDLPFRLPALLHERGVPFCLSYTGDMERMGARNLPFVAGTARAHGLPPEEAITVSATDGPVEVTLDIVPDDYEPYAILSALDPFGEELAHVRVDAGFKLNRSSATKWVEGGFGAVR